MENHNRGRSPSAGHQNQPLRHTPSPSPHAQFRNSNNALGLDQTLPSYDNTPFNGHHLSNQQPSFDGANFSQNQLYSDQSDLSQGSFYQNQGLPQGLAQGLDPGAQYGQQGSNLFPDFGNPNDLSGLSGSLDPPLFDTTGTNGGDLLFSSGALDPQLLGSQPSQQQSINPTSLANPMTSHTQSPTPPHLLSPAMQRQSSGSPHGSPAMQQTGFQQPSPRHSRNTSLDPSSAAYPQQQQLQGGEWNGMSYRQHRRQPSDARSDVSSSAHPSPYLNNADSFDQVDHHSPLLGAQQDPSMYQEVMGIGNFSISERTPSYISPAHSPHISPHLPPQQHQLPAFTSSDSFGMLPGYAPQPMHNHYNGHQGMEMFPPQGQEAFPTLNQDYNNGDPMSPPEISIQLAPPSRQASFDPPKPDASVDGALSPPERSRNRKRSKSDTSGTRARSESKTDQKDMLSPAAAGVGSRSPSPSGKGRRSSTSSVPNRDYILDLADPSRPTSAQSGESAASKRTQKHPATFQCSLCPKRFTRAYNLRSHLRTHTDERPFVCSVCGKAFARQHDRKRHEGLHSGEKKFVCRGGLKDGANWGCGRRFARADALGRHFRSEAGRVCIQPLLEEEAIERTNNQNREAGLPPLMGQMPGSSGQPMMHQQAGYDGYAGGPTGYDNMPMSYNRLPAALLQQYPTLGPLWDNLPTNGPDEGEDNISGHNSFDGSSGGEYEDDGDYSHPQSGWASDVGVY